MPQVCSSPLVQQPQIIVSIGSKQNWAYFHDDCFVSRVSVCILFCFVYVVLLFAFDMPNLVPIIDSDCNWKLGSHKNYVACDVKINSYCQTSIKKVYFSTAVRYKKLTPSLGMKNRKKNIQKFFEHFKKKQLKAPIKLKNKI